jgi:hypothetical protein
LQGVRGRNAARQAKKRLQPGPLGLAVILDFVPALGPAQYRGYGDEQNILQQMFFGPLHPRIG